MGTLYVMLNTETLEKRNKGNDCSEENLVYLIA